jgi:hypothetical protein
MAVQKIEEFVFSGFLGDRAMYEESSCSQKKKKSSGQISSIYVKRILCERHQASFDLIINDPLRNFVFLNSVLHLK